MAELDQEGRVRAAGGLVWRKGRNQQVEYLVVHRPKYDDWTIPKGKAEPAESDEQTAAREVREETGLRCELEVEIASSEYADQVGRPKLVRFWLMRPVEGTLLTNAEVDRFEWVPASEARSKLSHESDRLVLDSGSETVRRRRFGEAH